MSVYTLVFGGLIPIGNLYAGAITNKFGPRAGFIACGAIILLLFLALYFFGGKHRISSFASEDCKTINQ